MSQRPKQLIVVNIFQGIGDIVLSTPCLRIMRERFADARIVVAGPEGRISILAHEPYIDAILPIIFARGTKGALSGLRYCQTIRRLKPDVWVDLTTPLFLSTYLKSRIMSTLGGARVRYGPGLKHVLRLGFGREAVHYRQRCHEAELKLKFIEKIGGNGPPGPPSLFHSDAFTPFMLNESNETPRVGIAPGAARQSRQWPIERFVATLRELVNLQDVQLVLLGSPQERNLACKLKDLLGWKKTIDLTGAIPVEQLPSTVAALDVILTNDSGLMHIAAAVGTPLVAILGPELLSRYAPLGDSRITRIFHQPYPCSPCLRDRCGHQSCMSWIQPRVVATAISEMLDASRCHRQEPKRSLAVSNLQSEPIRC